MSKILNMGEHSAAACICQIFFTFIQKQIRKATTWQQAVTTPVNQDYLMPRANCPVQVLNVHFEGAEQTRR
jgi:hypothetical protein